MASFRVLKSVYSDSALTPGAAVLLGPNCSMPYDYILVCIDRGYAGASDKADIFRSAPRRYVGSARPKEPVGREPTLVRFEVRHEKASDQ